MITYPAPPAARRRRKAAALTRFWQVIEQKRRLPFLDPSRNTRSQSSAPQVPSRSPLLSHGETVIAARHDQAWLAVVAGNLRARRFYERNGWSETGELDYPARTAAGVSVVVPARHYQKRLTRHVARSAAARAGSGRPPTTPSTGGRTGSDPTGPAPRTAA